MPYAPNPDPTPSAAHRLDEAQVRAAFRTQGLAPVASPAHIATLVGAQLRAIAPVFKRLLWGAEPTHFRLVLEHEA